MDYGGVTGSVAATLFGREQQIRGSYVVWTGATDSGAATMFGRGQQIRGRPR